MRERFAATEVLSMGQPGEKRLRHVVIGIGGAVFTEHVSAFALPTVEVVAVSDINVEKGKQRADQFSGAI
jgi:predicted dehydrogenase